MRYLLLSLFLALVIAFPSSVMSKEPDCDLSDPNPSGTRTRISGRVVDCDGKPISGVCVNLYWPVGSNNHREDFSTDAGGNFYFSSNPPDDAGFGFIEFGIGIGADAYTKPGQGYFSRIGNPSPSFRFTNGQTGGCADINCGYTTNIGNVAGIPARYSYAVWGKSQDWFTDRFVSTEQNSFASGFNFEMVAESDGTLCEEDQKPPPPPVTIKKLQKIFCDDKGDPVVDPATGEYYSAIGCIPINDIGKFTSVILPFGISVAGGIAFLLIMLGTLRVMSSSGNPDKVKSGKDMIFAGLSGLMLFIFAIFVYRLIGVDILQLPGL